MAVSYKSYKYVPMWVIEGNLKYCDWIRELNTKVKEEKKKKKILLDKISNLEIQNYMLKKKVAEYERNINK